MDVLCSSVPGIWLFEGNANRDHFNVFDRTVFEIGRLLAGRSSTDEDAEDPIPNTLFPAEDEDTGKNLTPTHGPYRYYRLIIADLTIEEATRRDDDGFYALQRIFWDSSINGYDRVSFQHLSRATESFLALNEGKQVSVAIAIEFCLWDVALALLDKVAAKGECVLL